jgi:2-desacetyl-2-hydroxyethyl bacteriochlorophyllide A dehydrogenase
MDCRDWVAVVNQILTLTAPKTLEWREVGLLPLAGHELRVQTYFSGISAGTELTQYRGSNPLLQKAFDQRLRLFESAPDKAAFPLEGWGYEQAGQVVAVGTDVTQVAVGDRVWGSWGHRRFATLPEDVAAPRKLSQQPTLHGIFGRIGAIALNPVHDGEIRLGDWVAVFGLGVIGLLALQLCKKSGAKVIAVDQIAPRLQLAKQLGADVVLNAENAASQIKQITGRGADVCLEVSGSYLALHQAIRAAAFNSRVVCAGFMQGEGLGLALGEEFHHNRIQLICSQTGGVHPSLDHRWDRLRLEQTFMEQSLPLEPLVSHRFSHLEADRAFGLLDQNPAEALQVVLEFPND